MTHVSYAELRRMAPDALRMAGLRLSQADEAAEMLAWTQAVHGTALAFVLDRVAGSPRTVPAILKEEPGRTVVDCAGATLFELGARLVDFARSGLVEGTTELLVHNTSGVEFLDHPGLSARPAGCHVVVEESGTGVVTIRCSSIAPEPVGAPPMPAGAAGERLRAALRFGMNVADAEFAAFAALAARIRVPTSERSRAQAG